MSCLISFPIIDCWNQNKKKYGSVNFIIWLYSDNRYMYVNKYLTPVHYKRKIKTLVTYSRLYHYHGILHQLVYYLPSLLVIQYEFILLWRRLKQVSSIYYDRFK